MSPDADLSPLTLLLYLLAFAAAAAGILLTLLPRLNPSDRRTRKAGYFLQTLVITGIIPSLQVILSALEITPNMQGYWPLALNLIFNALIIAGITASSLIWHDTTRVFSPAPFPTDRLSRPVFVVVLIASAGTLITQTMAAIYYSRAVINIAGYSLLLLIVLLATLVLSAALRVLRPKNGAGNRRTGTIIKSIVPMMILFTTLFILLPHNSANMVTPIALITVFTSGILLYIWQNAASDDSASVRSQLFEDSGLTDREREIAVMLAEGLSYKDISARLFVSLSTVQTHVTRIYGKMDVKSKTELSRKITGQ